MDDFKDIIDLPHHVSAKRIPMTLHARAAQFAPFAALTGYDDEVEETARLTDSFISLTDDQTDELNKAFQKMTETERPVVTVRYFIPDSRKHGGSYAEYRGCFRFFDQENNILKFTDGMTISADMICSIENE